MKKVLCFTIVLSLLVLVSCAGSLTTGSGAPIFGANANAQLVVKDFEAKGIIFVSSLEIVDRMGNVSGSKITYEMLMKKAVELGADDVINVRVDVKRTVNVDNTVFDYTGTALAIKYTTVADIPRVFKERQEPQYESMAVTLPEAKAPAGNTKSGGMVVLGILGGLLLVLLISAAAS